MNDLKGRIESKIKNLEWLIEFRTNSESWLSETRERDTNRYYWFHCGEWNKYVGKLEALKEILGELV